MRMIPLFIGMRMIPLMVLIGLIALIPFRAISLTSHEDNLGLQLLDTTFRAKTGFYANTSQQNRALSLIHNVIDRIAQFHIKSFSVSELANFATQRIRLHQGKTQPLSLAYIAIDTLVQRINDPYASFEQNKTQNRNKQKGEIGIEATISNKQLKVIAPLEGGPAAKAGIKAGDIILKINGATIYNLKLSEAMKRIRGPVGTNILLRINRAGVRKLELPITRTRFRIKAVRHEVLGEIIYIKIAYFGPFTTKLFRKLLAEVNQSLAGVVPIGYVIDVRGNPGGLVGQAILLADAFLEKGMIIETIGRDKKKAQHYNAYTGDLLNGAPIIILQNAGTASASEILAAALKDNNRAIIMGTKSYGKGLVQTAYPFGTFGRMKFTTHKYMTASGMPIHNVGVQPNIVINSNPQPTKNTKSVSIHSCPAAGKARDRMLGCAIKLHKLGLRIGEFVNALSKRKID